jgi:hypothetical protein
MIAGITAGQVMPHRWSSTSLFNGGSTILTHAGSPLLTSVSFAGTGSVLFNMADPANRATFAGAGQMSVALRMKLPALATFVGAGNLAAAAAAQAFLAFAARCTAAGSTLVGSDETNYKNLLDGLTTDGLINGDGTSNFLDALWILAAPNTTVAVLNLIKSSFTLTPNGSPSFTAYQGYTGVAGSTTVYINTGFTPSTAGGVYVQNSAHISVWSNNNVGLTTQVLMGVNTTSPATSTHLFPALTGSNAAFFRINDTTAGASNGISNATTNGFWLATRSGASAQKGYRNAVDQGVTAVASGALSGSPFFILGIDNDGSSSNGYSGQVSAVSIGANLNSTQVTALFNRLATYRTAVGL